MVSQKLVQAMLCKVKEDTDINIAGTPILLVSSTSTNLPKGDNRVYNNNFNGDKGTYKVYLTGSADTFGPAFTYKLVMGDNSIDKRFTIPKPEWTNFNLNNTIIKSTNGAETLKVGINSDYNYETSTLNVSNLYIQQTKKTMPGTTGVTGKPRVLKDITQKATITIFGVHIDNTRVTQD